MKFSIDDDTVLRVSAISTALFAVHSLAAPKDFQASYKIIYVGKKGMHSASAGKPTAILAHE